MKGLGLAFGLLVASVATAAAKPKPPPVNEQTVTDAISRAAEWLFSAANKQGVWDDPDPPDFKLAMQWKGDQPIMKTQWPGVTALALNALAAAGRQSDPRFGKALRWLMEQQMIGTYGLGMRMELIRRLRDSQPYRPVLKADARMVLRGLRAGKECAMWQYTPPPGKCFYAFTGDFSNTNYGVLGLWAASDERLETGPEVWRALERTYLTGQLDDGGWAYYHRVNVTPKSRATGHYSSASMTTAGIASLYLVLDQLHVRSGKLGAFRKTDAYQAIQRGLAWMAKHFSATTNPGWPEFATYYFYNCERVASAAGIKYFGTHDWFREIAATLLRAQRANGSIPYKTSAGYGGVPVDTAFALLFLARGSAPIIYNKLQHAGDWDNHIRELAALTDWLARQSERPANWQVVNLKVPAEDLTDSRILYIAGTKTLAFSAEEKAKLKRFVELGGLLVFHPDRPSIAFQGSTMKLLGELWPKLELSAVDLKTHPIGRIYVPLRGAAQLQQLAAPTRVLAFVLHGAPASVWERREHARRKHVYELGAALHYFANDRAPLKKMPTKLTRFAEIFRRELPAPTRAFTLGRIRYGDNPHRWDPEPLAMARFARALQADRKVRCRVRTLAPRELASAGVKVAHLTGVDAAPEVARDWDAIDAWLRAGGTLIVDRAGGPPADRGDGSFDSAFRKLLAERYGERSLAPLPLSGPLLDGLEKVPYRNVMGLRRKALRPRLECVRIAGRPAVTYSRYDLTCGLLGNPNPLVSGADATGAYEIFSRLLLAAGGLEHSRTAPVPGGR